MNFRTVVGDERKCSACGGVSRRVVDDKVGDRTYFGIDAFDTSPRAYGVPRPLGSGITGSAYACTRCAHLDFFLNMFGTKDASP
jgi:hypothetical protein